MLGFSQPLLTLDLPSMGGSDKKAAPCGFQCGHAFFKGYQNIHL